jgi:hypothetical protein
VKRSGGNSGYSNMDFGKKNYGRLGYLKRGEWKRKLKSNSGLFQIRRTTETARPGPHINENGRIQGGLGLMEDVFFQKICTDEQRKFHQELMQVNPIAGREFAFTIDGSVDIWKEDLKLMEFALKVLEKENSTMHYEEKLMQEANKKKITVKLPPVLKKHFPQLFNDVEFKGIGLEGLINKIKLMEEKVEAEEHYIKDYLNMIERDMPFLFE